MAGEMDVHVVTAYVGAFTGATEIPLIYIPATGGDITIVDAQIRGASAGTSIGLVLTTMSDLGTPAAVATFATFSGTVVYAAGVVFEATVGTPVVGCGQWIGIDQTSGTCPATTVLNISYVMGK